jgi:hypothetical protein
VDGLPLYEVSYFALILFVLAVIDSTILVTLDMDFFHRNTLRWRQIRYIAYTIYLADIAILFLVTMNLIPQFQQGGIIVIGSFYVVLAYAVATLLIGARRTPDKPLKRFVELAGILLLGFIINTLINNYTYIDAVDVFNDFLGVSIAYVTYLMVMSLSPTGKVDKGEFVVTKVK